MVGAVRVDEACRLMTVHSFSKITVEECLLDVELMHWPSSCCREVDCAHSRWFHHWGERLMEVNVGALGEASNNPSCLAAFQCTVRIQLVLEEPLPGDHIGLSGARHKCPRVVVLQGVELFLHRSQPLWVSEHGTDSGRWRCWCRRGGHVHILGIRLVNPSLRTRDHRVSLRWRGSRPSR